MKKNIKVLLDNDVPVFVSAGNHAVEKDKGGNIIRRPNVDTTPGIFEGENYPLIVVGAVNFDGTTYFGSQAGPHVQLWAPGVDVSVQKRDDDGERITQGTSYATSLMAGMLATYLAYDTVPFDTSEGNLVAAAKNYLVNKASWARAQSLKALGTKLTRLTIQRKMLLLLPLLRLQQRRKLPQHYRRTQLHRSPQLRPPLHTRK